MFQKIYTPTQIQSILQLVFIEHNKKAVLFGSYAKGAQGDKAILIYWLTPDSGVGKEIRKSGVVIYVMKGNRQK